ncbi:MAG: hypothetical protein CV087_17370 [Candidatus Brocadia sp. WS118]|nr:MAG: hypothetical protein CV087_17370 [Candidatus Brocadia sp. WS118]
MQGKKSFKITSLHESENCDYWKNKTYRERIAALEKLKRIMFGYDPSTDKRQRILTITQHKKIQYLMLKVRRCPLRVNSDGTLCRAISRGKRGDSCSLPIKS